MKFKLPYNREEFEVNKHRFETKNKTDLFVPNVKSKETHFYANIAEEDFEKLLSAFGTDIEQVPDDSDEWPGNADHKRFMEFVKMTKNQ